MTETVDSKAWSASIKLEALNFQDTIAPPARISAEEWMGRISLAQAGEQGWLSAAPRSQESVLRGLSQVGSIDRGSFASYAR